MSPKVVDLSPEDTARYRREAAHQAKVERALQPGRRRFRCGCGGLAGRLSDGFGKRRVLKNGQPRAPHSGADIRTNRAGRDVACRRQVIDTGDYLRMATRF